MDNVYGAVWIDRGRSFNLSTNICLDEARGLVEDFLGRHIDCDDLPLPGQNKAFHNAARVKEVLCIWGWEG